MIWVYLTIALLFLTLFVDGPFDGVFNPCKKCGSRKGYSVVTGGNWSGTWSRTYCKKCRENV